MPRARRALPRRRCAARGELLPEGEECGGSVVATEVARGAQGFIEERRHSCRRTRDDRSVVIPCDELRIRGARIVVLHLAQGLQRGDALRFGCGGDRAACPRSGGSRRDRPTTSRGSARACARRRSDAPGASRSSALVSFAGLMMPASCPFSNPSSAWARRTSCDWILSRKPRARSRFFASRVSQRRRMDLLDEDLA